MSRRLPPFAAIRAFEAAGRLLSFRAAADELSRTPSAISHQVRSLESFLGQPMFLRDTDGVTLTDIGERYLAQCRRLLDGLDASTREIAECREAAPFAIHCTPGFAARWLAPRLARCPLAERIEIAVSTGAPSIDFATNGADVVIAWQTETRSGVVTEPLMTSARFPVASPALARRLTAPEKLAETTLLHDEVLDAWARWFALAGVPSPQLPLGPRLPHCDLTLSAAERGQGVALAYDAMARSALRDGTLVRLFDVEVPPITIYSVAYPAHLARCPDIRAFRDWIFAEVAREGTGAGPAEVLTVRQRCREAAG